MLKVTFRIWFTFGADAVLKQLDKQQFLSLSLFFTWTKISCSADFSKQLLVYSLYKTPPLLYNKLVSQAASVEFNLVEIGD